MSDQKFKNPGREKNIFNDYRLPHPQTKTIAEGSKYHGQLTWAITSGGEIVMLCNDGVYDPNNKNAGRMKEVKLTPMDRGSLFSLIRSAAGDKDFTKSTLPIRRKEFVFENGRSRLSESPITICEFTVIRTPKGEIDLGYRKGDYRVLYGLTNPNNLMKTFKDGQWQEDPGMTSRVYVDGYLTWIENGLNTLENARHQPPKPKNGGDNNSNSNNNNRSNSGYSDSSSDGDFDDDVMF